MTVPRPLAIAGTIIGGLILFLFLTVLFIPTGQLLGLANRQLAPSGYSLEAADLGKVLPLGLSARNLELRSDRGALLKADALTVRLQLLPLLTGRVRLGLSARVGNGTLDGYLTLTRGKELRLNASGIRLEDIPFFATVAGARIKGVLQLHGTVKLAGVPTGSLQLEVEKADLQGIKLGEMPLPDADFTRVQGMLRFAANRATLESFSLQGTDLYVRLKGGMPLTAPISAAPLDLTLELMPKPAFMEKQKFIFLLLTKYLDTPGHYQIPIGGVLGKPLIR